MRTTRSLILALPLLGLVGCPSGPTTDDPTPRPALELSVAEHAEGTSPLHPMLPWPSDRWLEEDTTTVTGWRLAYDDVAIPRNRSDEFFVVEPYRRLDGFSLASQPMVTFGPPVSMDNLAAEGEYPETLDPDSPTVLLNLDTGERVPHFVQNDLRVEELEPGADTVVYLHPATQLAPDTRYAAVYRTSVTLADGSPLPEWEAFAALRNGVITTSDDLEARRPRYEAMFDALEAAGVPRQDVAFAWTFRTASDDSIQRELLSMRDDAMERVPRDTGGECTVEEVTVYEESCPEDARDDCQEHSQIRARIKGTFRSPLYMDREIAPTQAVRDAETGLPVFQGWHDVDFSMHIPHVAYASNDGARFVTYGHGLMGDQGEAMGGYSRGMAAEYNLVIAGIDMHGMSTWDIVTVGQALADMGKFVNVTERLMQGHINTAVMTRSLTGGCRTMPALADHGLPTELPLADEAPYYLGISQGSIFGGVQAAINQDIERYALLVGGSNYSVMIPRSSNFPDYEQIFLPWYPRRVDQQVMLALIMSLWDKSEPSGFVHRVLSNPLPNTPTKKVLHQVAVNDSQVPNLSSDIMGRTMGMPILTPTSKGVWGMPEVTGADEVTSALVYFDLDRDLGSEGNVPPPDGNGAHGDQRYIDAARQQLDAFFHPDGVIEDFCGGDGCSPE